MERQLPPPAAADPILQIRGLTMRYGDHTAVDAVDLDVGRGEIVGILGHNGAGKTTTVECAQGLRTPTAGSVSILGVDVVRHRNQLGSRVGSQLQDSSLPDRLRVGEAMRLFSDRPVGPDDVAAWGLDHLWSQAFGTLSGGQQQRLFIALALVNSPELVFLDELTQGLDPVARQEIWATIRQVRDGGTTVVLVTHFVDEAEALCDRVVVMADGSVRAEGAPDDLVDRHGPGVGMRYTDPAADAVALQRVPGVRHLAVSGTTVELRGDRRMIAHVGAHLVANGEPPADLSVIEPNLGDALIDIMTDPAPTTEPVPTRTAAAV